jgi:hypothetical protein
VGFAGDEHDDSCDDGGDEKGEVDLDIREEDEPFVTATLFEFASRLGAAYAARWIFTSNTCVLLASTLVLPSLSPPQEQNDPDLNSPIPKKNRYATSAANKPVGLPPAPYDPVHSAAKTRIIIVDANSDHLREKWSDVYPKNNMPTTVPANVMLATFACAEDLLYASG